ncbi:hypothetical protein ABG768_004074 [Culter alburnus]|uniref:Uncharacterized protein n=1 Tax=Culter alburnus TaxID=194366 RepID=A0AAW2A1N8_CULAL
MRSRVPLQILLYATVIRSLKVVSKRGSGKKPCCPRDDRLMAALVSVAGRVSSAIIRTNLDQWGVTAGRTETSHGNILKVAPRGKRS